MKILNRLRPEDIAWIEANKFCFEGKNRSLTTEQITGLFVILSWLTAKNQKANSCGRCIISARDIVWATYNKQD